MDKPKAYKGKEPFIFISYAHDDSDRVMPIIFGLQERGYRVWYDGGIRPGTEFAEFIGEQINDCGAFLCFMSANSANSKFCRKEIMLAIDLDKDPLVIYLEEVELSLGMRLELRPLQHMYYDRHANLDSFLDELCESEMLECCHGDAPPPTPRPQTSAAPTPNQGYYSSAPQQAPQGGSFSPYQNMGGAAPNGMFYSVPMMGMFGTMPNQSAMWGMPPTASNEMRFEAALQHPVLTEMARLLKELADEGYVPAISRLGLFYEYGNGVPQNMAEAVSMYRTAAAFGDVDAHRYLADCYKDGKGVEKDLNLYKTCLLKAGELGSGMAQNEIGNNYADGKNGFPKNKEEAIRWYERAVQQGYPGASLGLNMVKLGI